MTSQTIPVPPFDFVIFGATGDLTRRKLLPSLYQRQCSGQFSEPTRILGASRTKMDSNGFRQIAREAVSRNVQPAELDEGELATFLNRLEYVTVDANTGEGFEDLGALLGESTAIRAFYLAVAPELFDDICSTLQGTGLVNENARVIVEKPIGKDLASATALNDAVGRVFAEHRIFRIDHYLGKETVQNLMVLRFANSFYEPLWNSAHVDHVQITVSETMGVEGRADYYDRAGALRDMVQNHMLQLLCLVAMEPPSDLDSDAVRDEKLKVLRALAPIAGRDAATQTVRGQYRAGAASGAAVPSYAAELGGVASSTETFVALKAEIANWRWAGVPFYLRTGKRLAARVSEIVVQFKPIPHSIFGEGAGPVRANQLVIRLQPDEGVKQWMMIKDPGPGGMRLRHVPLDMSFAEAFNVRNPDAYERLIMDVVRGNQTLFMRRDEVEAAWRWIDPILAAWSDSPQDIRPYTAGTWGPSAAIALIERDGRTWHDSDE